MRCTYRSRFGVSLHLHLPVSMCYKHPVLSPRSIREGNCICLVSFFPVGVRRTSTLRAAWNVATLQLSRANHNLTRARQCRDSVTVYIYIGTWVLEPLLWHDVMFTGCTLAKPTYLLIIGMDTGHYDFMVVYTRHYDIMVVYSAIKMSRGGMGTSTGLRCPFVDIQSGCYRYYTGKTVT